MPGLASGVMKITVPKVGFAEVCQVDERDTTQIETHQEGISCHLFLGSEILDRLQTLDLADRFCGYGSLAGLGNTGIGIREGILLWCQSLRHGFVVGSTENAEIEGTGVAAYKSARLNGAKVNEALRRSVTGGVGGTLRSGVSGAKKGVKSMHDITGNARDNFARSGRIAGANVGSSVVGRTGARMAMAASAPTKFDRMQQNSKDMNEMANLFGEVKSFAQSDGTALAGVAGNTSFKFVNSMGGNSTADLTKLGISSAKDAHDYVERIKASGASDAQIKLAEDLEKAVLDNYYSTFEGDKKHFVGAKLQRFNDLQAKQQNNLSGVGAAGSVNDMKKAVSSIRSQAASYVLSDEYITAERNKNAAAARRSGGGK